MAYIPALNRFATHFRDGAQALADGRMGRDGIFHSGNILAKCASKYEAKLGQISPGDLPVRVTSSRIATNNENV